MRRTLLVLAGAALLGGCADDAPPGPTLDGESPPVDGELAPDATVQPGADLVPEAEVVPGPTLEPEATLQPDSTGSPE